ncbi:MAG: hypothetical protein WC967_07300 [Balneolaceae bacterium]
MKYLVIVFYLIISTVGLSAQERSIELDLDYLLSNFVLYVTEDHFIALDRQIPACYIFSKETGEFIKEINPMDTFPGFNWQPIQLEVLRDDIFFTNSAPWAFLISKNNDSVRVFDKSFLPPSGFKFITDSTFVGFYTEKNGSHSLKTYNTKGEMLIDFEVPDLNAKNMLYRVSNFYIHQFEDKIYFINPLDNVLYKYSQNGELLGSVVIHIPSFNKITRDINPSKNPHQVIGEVVKSLRTNSTIQSSYKLDESHLLLIVKHKNNATELVVFNTKDERITKVEEILDGKTPWYVFKNKFYYVYPSEENYTIHEKVFHY